MTNDFSLFVSAENRQFFFCLGFGKRKSKRRKDERFERLFDRWNTDEEGVYIWHVNIGKVTYQKNIGKVDKNGFVKNGFMKFKQNECKMHTILEMFPTNESFI